MTLFLVFGTSTTYGAWDIEGGWVQRLRKYLDQKQFNNPDLYYVVYNLGISGDTSEGMLERFEFETKQRLALRDEGEEVIIMICVGVNDSIYNNKTKKNQVDLNKYASNIEKLIRLAKKYTTKVIFIGNKPIDEKRVDPLPWLEGCSYKKEFVELYDNKIADLCKKNNLLFLDVYHMFIKIKDYSKLLTDGVHPSTEGHKIIYEMIRDFLINEKII